MRRALSAACLLLVALFLLPQPGTARRLPSTVRGDTVRIVANDTEWSAIVRNHSTVALMEELDRSNSSSWRAGTKPLAGLGGARLWRSNVIEDLTGTEDGMTWTGTLHSDAADSVLEELVLAGLQTCFAPPPKGSWPGAVLSQLGVAVTITKRPTGPDPAAGDATPSGFTIRFGQPVGALPELLSGCSLGAQSDRAPYRLVDGALVARPASRTAEPLIGRIVRERSAERADVLIDAATYGTKTQQLTGASDVVLLLTPTEVPHNDPFKLRNLDAGERAARLAATPLLAALNLGRGGGTTTLLPPGLGPARPLQAQPTPVEPVPTPTEGQAPQLRPSPAGQTAAPVLIDWPSNDPLLKEVAARLALLAQSAGLPCAVGPGGYRLLRFQPQSKDPALALLELAALTTGLSVSADNTESSSLLSASRSQRTLAALELESEWLRHGAVLPLLSTQHWLAISQRVRGVTLTPGGTPSLWNAWTSAPSENGQR